MAYATDDLKAAEILIQKVIFDSAVGKTLEICQWLLSFNAQEKHKVKCYQTFGNRPDIRFCIDRGTDCEGDKIMTCFLVIEPNFELMGLYSKNPEKYSYFKRNEKRWRINSKDTIELSMSTIREHIFESYELLLKTPKISLVSKVSRTNDALQQNSDQIRDNAYLPTREDIDLAESQLRKNSDEIIGIETVLDQVEINFKKVGKPLKGNWREVTKQNIKIWFRCNSVKN